MVDSKLSPKCLVWEGCFYTRLTPALLIGRNQKMTFTHNCYWSVALLLNDRPDKFYRQADIQSLCLGDTGARFLVQGCNPKLNSAKNSGLQIRQHLATVIGTFCII